MSRVTETQQKRFFLVGSKAGGKQVSSHHSAAGRGDWVQVDAFSTPASTNFSWVNTDSSGAVDAGGLPGWSYGNSVFYSTNNGGSGWSANSTGTTFPQFSVQYQAVPEPAAAAAFTGLAAFGLLGCQLGRRRRPVTGPGTR